MAGYNGFSMSNNAVNAYHDGEMPYSKWTKQEIISHLSNTQAEFCKKLTSDELRFSILEKCSWHHSSKFYNRVDFYRINDDKVEELTKEQVAMLIGNRKIKKNIEKVAAEEPTFITAYVQYSEWVGTRSHPKKITKNDYVFFKKNDKMVECPNAETKSKRFSSVVIIYQIEQPNEYASKETLKEKYKIKEN